MYLERPQALGMVAWLTPNVSLRSAVAVRSPGHSRFPPLVFPLSPSCRSFSLVPAPIAVVSRPFPPSRPPLSEEPSTVRYRLAVVELSCSAFLVLFSLFPLWRDFWLGFHTPLSHFTVLSCLTGSGLTLHRCTTSSQGPEGPNSCLGVVIGGSCKLGSRHVGLG